MNITISESLMIYEAKLCGCNNKKKVVYGFSEPVHSLCIDKNQLILSQMQACRNLMPSITDETELNTVKKELNELNTIYENLFPQK
jgi:hypothetical protein